MKVVEKKYIFILSLTSDIGMALAKKYSKQGYYIIGTYRSEKYLEQVKKIPNCQLIYCDLENLESINNCVIEYKKLDVMWDMFISCPCTPLPLGSFFKCNFDEWSHSIHVNVLEQLRVLHLMYPFKNKAKTCDVTFFAGGGTNNAVLNFSAYTISKIMLMKMCELIDAEEESLNIFIVGPGWTKTKNHQVTLEHVDKNDKKYFETIEFMNNGTGTSMEDIYGCIDWLCKQGKDVASGRNFSVVNDKWKSADHMNLAEALRLDHNMYKLRRCKNDF